jgi:hypothetical protein
MPHHLGGTELDPVRAAGGVAEGSGDVRQRKVLAADPGVHGTGRRVEGQDVQLGDVVDVDQRPVVGAVPDAGHGTRGAPRLDEERLCQSAGAAVDQPGHHHHRVLSGGGPGEHPLLVLQAPGGDARRAQRGVLVDDPVGVAVHPHPARVHIRAASRAVLQRLRRRAVDVRGALGVVHPEVDDPVGTAGRLA